MIPAPPFDATEYRRRPDQYLAISVPGRVWQSAQPAEGVPVIESLSKSLQQIQQGEAVRLEVKAVANMPVTFTSFDLGAFENGLASVTVAADEDGIATATLTATPGSIANIKVLAASPEASGRTRFIVNVVK
ncbi:hypothetical protein [Rubripirellula lacrimiformis]|nr:hypothetical protein [Rubripirellula lacrimiformis]